MKMKLFTGMLLGAMIGFAAIFAFNSCSKNEVSDGEYHCWAVSYEYYGESETWYTWDTEANIMKMVREMKAEYGSEISNVNYKRTSAKNEDSCDNLNYGGGDDNGGDDNGGDDNGGSQGGGGEEPAETSYYIKHPWNGGEWSWKYMYKEGSSYTCTGVWGGTGANISTTADDSNSEWYPSSSISGASYVSAGESVTFTFIPSSGAKGTLSVSSNGGGSQGGGGDNGGNQGGDGENTNVAPDAPTGLTATLSSSKVAPYIELRWDPNSDYSITYDIYRSTSSSGSYSKIKSGQYGDSYQDNNISNNHTYYYKIKAVNSKGKESGYSNVASCKVEIVWEPAPPKITSLKASNNYTSLTIKWDYTVVNNAYGMPTEVQLENGGPTLLDTAQDYIFDWTSASSKKTVTINVSDFVGDNVLYDRTLYLKVRNSAGDNYTEIIWSPSKRKVYVGGNQKQYFDL